MKLVVENWKSGGMCAFEEAEGQLHPWEHLDVSQLGMEEKIYISKYCNISPHNILPIFPPYLSYIFIAIYYKPPLSEFRIQQNNAVSFYYIWLF